MQEDYGISAIVIHADINWKKAYDCTRELGELATIHLFACTDIGDQ